MGYSPQGHKVSDTTEQLHSLTQVGHRFSSKEKASFNFTAVIIICSDSGARENKVCHCFHCFPIFLP